MGNRESNGNQEQNGKKKGTISVKSIIIIIVIFIAAFFCGFGVSMLNFELGDRGISLPDMMPAMWHAIYPYLKAICIASCVVFNIYMFRRYREIRNLSAQADDDNEELLDELEKKSSRIGIYYGMASACFMLFASFEIYDQELRIREGTGVDLTVQIPTLIYLACIVFAFVIYKRLIDMEMQRNPARKGDILNLFFHRQWEETSDEAQKKILYEAGYRAFIVCTHAAVICDCIAIVCMGLFHTGLFPCLLIFVIVITGQFTFTRVQYRLEQGGWKE